MWHCLICVCSGTTFSKRIALAQIHTFVRWPPLSSVVAVAISITLAKHSKSSYNTPTSLTLDDMVPLLGADASLRWITG